MRILLVSHDSFLYGAQRSLVDLSIALMEKGHLVEVCTPHEGELCDTLRKLGVPVHLVSYGRWIPSISRLPILTKMLLTPRVIFNIFRGSLASLSFLHKNSYNAIYTNTVTVINFSIAAKITGTPHVWHLRESIDKNNKLVSLFANKTAISIVKFLSDLVIYNSFHLLTTYGQQESKKAVVVHNGIDSQSFPARAWPTPASENLRMTLIGHMTHLKGLDLLLDALILIDKTQLRNLSLLVVGEIDSSYMRNTIKPRLEILGETVKFYGRSHNVSEILQTTDLLVSSSRQEAFGRTIVEAMFSAVPVLATRSGGPEEIVVDGVTGLLVKNESPEALAAGILQFIATPNLLAVFGKAGRARAIQQFSLDHHADSIERHIAICCAQSKPGETLQ